MTWIMSIASSVITALITVYLLAGADVLLPSSSQPQPTVSLTYADFLSLMLTCLGLLLASITVGLGVTAFKTINELKASTVDAAKKYTDEVMANVDAKVTDLLDVTVPNVLQTKLRGQVVEIVKEAAKDGKLNSAIRTALYSGVMGENNDGP